MNIMDFSRNEINDNVEQTENIKSENPVIENLQEKNGDLLDDSIDDTVPNVTDCLQIILNPESQNTEKPYICDYHGCKKAFTKPGGLSEHKKRNHDELDETLVEIIPNVTGGPPGYKCRQCNVFFPKYQMVLHLRSHTGERPHVCDFEGCNKAFARPGTLSEHKKRNHEKLLHHSCPICGKRFYERCVMLQHIVIHDEARQARERILPPQMMILLTQVEEFNFDGQVVKSKCVCEVCGKIFVNGSGKNRHVKGGQCRKYKCLEVGCGKSFFAESGLTRHLKEGHQLKSSPLKSEQLKKETEPVIKSESSEEFLLNTEEIKEEIPQEDYSFSENDVKVDIFHNPDKDILYTCDLCGNTLGSKQSLEVHKLIHEEINRFKCNEENCTEVFSSQNGLSKHQSSVHEIESKAENGSFHVCEECGKQCTTKGGLKDHMKKHSTEKKFMCMICGKKLKRSTTLAMHMKIHTGERDFQCDKCESSFVSSAALRNHTLSKHTDLTNAPQFICSYCGKVFPKKDYLLKHVTEHTGEKKYKCEVCGKCFRHETTLSSHLDMHYGIKKFQCPHCGKRFTQRQQMNMHVRRHTGDKRHKCNICGEAFIEPRSLRNHMKRRHEQEQPSETTNTIDIHSTHLQLQSPQIPRQPLQLQPTFHPPQFSPSRLHHPPLPSFLFAGHNSDL